MTSHANRTRPNNRTRSGPGPSLIRTRRDYACWVNGAQQAAEMALAGESVRPIRLAWRKWCDGSTEVSRECATVPPTSRASAQVRDRSTNVSREWCDPSTDVSREWCDPSTDVSREWCDPSTDVSRE